MSNTTKRINKGWQVLNLSNCLSVLESGSRPKGGVGNIISGIPSIGGEHLNDNGSFNLKDIRFVPHKFFMEMSKGHIFVGDILIVKDGATTGKTSIITRDWPYKQSAVNEHVFILRPNNQLTDEYLFYYLYSSIGQHSIQKSFQGSAQGGINQSFVNRISIPVPPIPVQERIVEILQKADEVRRKRQGALELATKILPSIFSESFLLNRASWIEMKLGEIVNAKSGGTPSRKKKEFWGGAVPWASPSDMKVLELNDTEEHISDIAVMRSSTNIAEPGSILIVFRSGILAHTFPVSLVKRNLAFNQDIKALLPKPDLMLPEYLFWALKILEPKILKTTVKRGSTVHSIDSARFFELPILVPPLPIQKVFVSQAIHLTKTLVQLEKNWKTSNILFDSLLSRAFTGELTAEWEKANAELILKRQAFYERLPQLVLLAFLQGQATRTDKTILLTALMKYIFLLQMEGAAQRRLYQFIPYKYGPFAKELYEDLEKLQNQGVLSVANGEEVKTEITIQDSKKAESMLAELPEELKEDVAKILDEYGNLNHNDLLSKVYEKYPTYAKKSKVKKPRLAL